MSNGLVNYGSIAANPSSVSSDLGYIGDEIAAQEAAAGSGLSQLSNILKGVGSAAGLGLSGYDFIENGPSFENTLGGVTSGLGLASSLGVAGAGPAAAVLALPLTFKSIFGKKSTRRPNYMDYSVADAPIYKDDDGNLYLLPERQMRIPGTLGDPYGLIRYNPSTNQFERPKYTEPDIEHTYQMLEDPTGPLGNVFYASGEWEPMKLYRGDDEHTGYWFHPGGKLDDLFSLASLQKVIQNDVSSDPTYSNYYNNFMRYAGKSVEDVVTDLQNKRNAEFAQREIEFCGSPGCLENVGI